MCLRAGEPDPGAGRLQNYKGQQVSGLQVSGMALKSQAASGTGEEEGCCCLVRISRSRTRPYLTLSSFLQTLCQIRRTRRLHAGTELGHRRKRTENSVSGNSRVTPSWSIIFRRTLSSGHGQSTDQVQKQQEQVAILLSQSLEEICTHAKSCLF